MYLVGKREKDFLRPSPAEATLIIYSKTCNSSRNDCSSIFGKRYSLWRSQRSFYNPWWHPQRRRWRAQTLQEWRAGHSP
jgi:hypothetical protein